MSVAVLCNTKIRGGGELSAQWLAGQLDASLVSLSTNEWRTCKAKKQIWYMNNSIYKLLEDKDDFRRVLGYADEIYIILNFVLGGFQRQRWAEEYPIKKIFFLNTEKKDEFKEKCVLELKQVPLVVLPPPVDIDKYLSVERNYDQLILTVGRHSRISLKYPDDPVTMYERLSEKTIARFSFMAAHPKIFKRFFNDGRFTFKALDSMDVAEYLKSIDIYLAIINPKTKDQGPRVLMEAMASGLPCIVEGRDGMKDRMIDGVTGYLVKSEEEAIDRVVELLNDRDKRIKMGQAARRIAATFRPELWVKELK